MKYTLYKVLQWTNDEHENREEKETIWKNLCEPTAEKEQVLNQHHEHCPV